MHLSLPDESVVGVLAGRQGDFTPDAGQEELVEQALDIVSRQTGMEWSKLDNVYFVTKR